MEDTILTIEEVANYLRVSDRTVYDWAQRGEIPAGKIGTVWRFKKSEVEKWVNDRLSSSDKRMKNDVVQVKNILAPNRVIFISQTSRHDALVELANTLSSAPQVKRSDELVSEILKREELMSTAIGRGIAIPHGENAVKDTIKKTGIVVLQYPEGVKFGDETAHLVIGIAGMGNDHLAILANIATMVGDYSDEQLAALFATKSADELYAVFMQED